VTAGETLFPAIPLFCFYNQ